MQESIKADSAIPHQGAWAHRKCGITQIPECVSSLVNGIVNHVHTGKISQPPLIFLAQENGDA